MKALTVLVIAGFALAGCATAPVKAPDFENSRAFQVPFDKTWGAIVAVIAENAFPIEAIEKESGIITTKPTLFANTWKAEKLIDSLAVRPGVFLGVWTKGRFTLSVFATKVNDTVTGVKVTSNIEAYEGNITYSWHPCQSKGIIEKAFLNNIAQKLKQ